MPTYVYHCEHCGADDERYYQCSSERKRHVTCKCGEQAEYDFARTSLGVQTKPTCWDRGHRSKAMGVHPEQAEQFEKEIHRRTGLSRVRIDRKTGEVITYSQKEKVKVAAAMGEITHGKPYVDCDGGYTS